MNYKNKKNLLLIIIIITVIVVLLYIVLQKLNVYNPYLARKNTVCTGLQAQCNATGVSGIKETFQSNLTTQVYCFWTGTNQMSDNRKKCLDTIRKNIGCSVILITPDNLAEYITPEYPLHKAYEYLSYTHKADYLRTYMMHVHGGGYTDIKEVNESWLPYFKLLVDSPNKWAIGYKEIGPGGIACNTNCEEVVHNWDKVIGNGGYIFKKQTPLTTDWFNGMNAKLDEKYEELMANPAQAPDDIPGKEIALSNGQKHISKYPMGWSEMLGGIFHPICYKYHDRLLNTLPPPKFEGYR